MHPLRLITLAGLGAACLAPAPAGATTTSYTRHRISYSETNVVREGYRDGASASILTPSAWQVLPTRDAKHLSFHEGAPGCRYSVTFTTRIAQEDAAGETPAQHVATKVPASAAGLVLDSGTRGASAAWRVIRIRSADRRIRLSAMRADHRRLSPRGYGWQETTASATEMAGGECHAGTYRNVLGPQIGDALATTTGRAYLFRA